VVHQGERLTSSLAFDAVIVALATWFVGGVYLDGWAHIHIPTLETFFTPWHGALYSGYFVSAIFLFAVLVKNMVNGYPLARALPAGYELSMVGAIVFALGGVGDLIWHTLFGIEANIDALLSPTHLLLATGASLIATGPLRAAWRRSSSQASGKTGFPALLPAVISLTIFYSVLTFFTEYASPFAETLVGMNRLPTTGREMLRFQALGVAGFLLQTAILMGILLFIMRRWRLPVGSLTLMMTLNTLAMALMHTGWFSTGTYVIIGVGVLAGLLGDVLNWRLMPSADRPAAFHWFAFLMPVVLYGLYFLALFIFGGGVWWTVHMWVGSIFMSGVVGLLLSYAVLPPPAPEL
jgi:hypothetical protein